MLKVFKWILAFIVGLLAYFAMSFIVTLVEARMVTNAPWLASILFGELDEYSALAFIPYAIHGLTCFPSAFLVALICGKCEGLSVSVVIALIVTVGIIAAVAAFMSGAGILDAIFKFISVVVGFVITFPFLS